MCNVQNVGVGIIPSARVTLDTGVTLDKFSRTDLQGFGQRPSQRDNYITKLDNKTLQINYFHRETL